jgi:hypothetical protein
MSLAVYAGILADRCAGLIAVVGLTALLRLITGT